MLSNYDLKEAERSKRIEKFILNFNNIDLDKEELESLMYNINLDLSLDKKHLDDSYLKLITYIDICKEIKNRIINHRIDIASLYEILKIKKKDYKKLLSGDETKIKEVEKKYDDNLFGKTINETVINSLYNTHVNIESKTDDIKFLYEVFNHCKKIILNTWNDIVNNLSEEEIAALKKEIEEK